MTSGPGRVPTERLFALLLRLFPRAFRARFGQDMRELFRDQARAARAKGARAVVRLWLTTAPSLVRSALGERWEVVRRRAAFERFSTTSWAGALGRIGGDVRYAMRMIRRSPGLTLVAVAVISVGSGGVTTIFSAMNAMLLQPLPGAANAGDLVGIERRQMARDEGISGSYPYYTFLRERARTLDAVAAWSKASFTISTGDGASSVVGNIVSGNFFPVLGVRPVRGRFFAADEDAVPMAQPVVVVSETFWRNRLGADERIIGATVNVNGRPYTLIGVAPAEFRGVFLPIVTDAWVPLMMQPHIRPGRDLGDASKLWLWVFGRQKPGVDREAVAREITSLTADWAAEGVEPASFAANGRIRLSDLTGLPVDASRAALGFIGLLMGAAVLVLLIASVNVAGLVSARSMARRREFAVRTALGAARGRLIRQLLIESVLLFGLGALGGFGLATFATAALERIPLPAEIPLALELSPDMRVLAFAVALSLVTGLVFGLTPALRASRDDITTRLRSDTPGSGSRRGIANDALIVGQLALSLVLLVTAGLFLRALGRGQRVDPGFQIGGVATAPMNPESWGYDDVRGRSFDEALRERLEALAGVSAVSFASVLPLTMNSSSDRIAPDGAPAGPDGDAATVFTQMASVDGGYFDALDLPIVAGRAFRASDDENAARVAVINETLGALLWPDGSALGRTFRYLGETVTVVGVARDAKYADLSAPTPGFAYFPMAQRWRSQQHLVVRANGDPMRLVPAIRRAVHDIDPALPPPLLRTMEEATSLVLLPQRVAAMVTGALGAVGLLLAAVGLYGIIAYSVSRRTRELGIRVALGARRGDVLGMIVREGLRLAGAGVVLGILLAAAASRLIGGFLFDVSPLDPATFIGMSVVFISIAVIASVLPARHAAASDPLTALRTD